MKWTPGAAPGAFLVQCGRLGPGIRVQVDDTVQGRSSLVVRADPGQVCVHELHCRDPPVRHRFLQVGDRGLEDLYALVLGDGRGWEGAIGVGRDRHQGQRGGQRACPNVTWRA